jgi:hypothetical protein
MMEMEIVFETLGANSTQTRPVAEADFFVTRMWRRSDDLMGLVHLLKHVVTITIHILRLIFHNILQ